MVTSGDRGAARSSSPAGLKGLFVAEIVRALQAGEVDLAVHSAKDLPAEDPQGVVVAAVPERASPLDVLISRDGRLGAGATVGSSSLRRRSQLLRARPYNVVDVRGNVDTRLRKMNEGEVDGLVLAQAGLARLGIVAQFAEAFSAEEMVPAPGQGALAVQARADGEVREVAAQLDHRPSRLAFEAERALVGRLGGGCALPLGALAQVYDGHVHLIGVVLRPDGSGMVRGESTADAPETAAREVAEALMSQGAAGILEELA
jgi:hydroxymethylbilane synthase